MPTRTIGKKEQAVSAFLGKLYESLTARPDIDADALPDDRFIAWCQPGLPFEKEDFTFALKGISGQSDAGVGAAPVDEGPSADAPPANGAPAPASTTGEDVNQRILRAADWSRLANFIPNPSGVYNEEQQKKMFDTTAFTQDGSSIASVYSNVLRFCEVADGELSDDIKAKLERFRGLLVETKEEEDLLTGETTEVITDSPVVQRYYEYMSEFLDASLEYNSKRLAALNASDPAAVQDWALNAHNYRRRVRAAHSKWVSTGHKNDIEKIWAFINQVTMRDLKLLKEDLLDRLDKATITDPTSGESFYWTSLIPAGLPFSDGWLGQSFVHSEISTHRESEHNAWSAKADIPVYSWFVRAKGEASSSEQRYESEVDVSNFSMSYEIAQAMVSRPWMSPEFLFSEAWRFGPNMPNLSNLTEALSDGKKPPSGAMIAYPTTAIFVRNVTVNFSELHSESSSFRKKIKGGASVSFGPINLGGGTYERGESTRSFERELTREGLTVPGMQLIGFKCKLLPKLPNPSAKVTKWS
jgi:hypothetical protein